MEGEAAAGAEDEEAAGGEDEEAAGEAGCSAMAVGCWELQLRAYLEGWTE